MFRNWRCNNYQVQLEEGNYSYQELKKYFVIDGTDETKCIKNFGECVAGNTYKVIEIFSGFLIY